MSPMRPGRRGPRRAPGAGPASGPRLDFPAAQACGEPEVRAAAAERVDAVREGPREQEAACPHGREDTDRELDERRSELEVRLQELRDAISAEIESAQETGSGRGPGEARERGYARGHREGFERGYADGRAAGHREARAEEGARLRGETAALKQMLDGVARGVSRTHRRFLEDARRELVRLAVRVAERVVQREVGREVEDVLLRNLGRAVDLVFRRGNMTIELNPLDLQALRDRDPDALDPLSDLSSIELSPCHDIERGGCRIVTGSGIVDRTLTSQLRMIEERLLELDTADGGHGNAERAAGESLR